MAEQTLNIPQLIVFIILAVLGVRWYLKPASNGTRQTSQQGRPVRINPAQVDQIAQMFPQFDRRQIAWDLQRNGGNMAATTERALSGRGLETPPTSFNPPLSRSQPASRSATPAAKLSQPDLITRYNLASKVNSTSESSTPADEIKSKAWSQDKTERQLNLQRRRDEMILAARRKMEEKDKARASETSA